MFNRLLHNYDSLMTVIVTIVLCIVQTSFLPTLLPNNLYINLFYSFILAHIMAKKYDQAYKLSLFGGIFYDALIFGNIGITSLIFTVLTWTYSQFGSFYIRGFAFKFLFFSLCLVIIYLLLTHSLLITYKVIIGVLVTLITSFIISKLIDRKNEEVNF